MQTPESFGSSLNSRWISSNGSNFEDRSGTRNTGGPAAAVSSFIRLEEVFRPPPLRAFWHHRDTAADRGGPLRTLR